MCTLRGRGERVGVAACPCGSTTPSFQLALLPPATLPGVLCCPHAPPARRPGPRPLTARSPAGHRLGVRGRAAPALLRQPLPERPHLLRLLEAAGAGRARGPAPVRGGGGGRGPAPARGGDHAERRVRARGPRRPDSAHRLLVLRVTGPAGATAPTSGQPSAATELRRLFAKIPAGAAQPARDARFQLGRFF